MYLPLEIAALPITPVLDTNAYATGDLLFDRVKVQSAVLNGKGFSYLRSALTLDSANQKSAYDLLFFNKDPGSLGALNSAVQLSAVQLALVAGILSVATADYTTIQANTNAIGQTKAADLPLSAIATSKDLWVAGVVRGTPTFLVASLTIIFNLERH